MTSDGARMMTMGIGDRKSAVKQTLLMAAGAFTLVAGCASPGITKLSDRITMPHDGNPAARPNGAIQHKPFPGPAGLPPEWTDAQSPRLSDLLDKPWLSRN